VLVRVDGAAQVINFELWGDERKHSLEYNAQHQTWRAGVTVIE